MEVLQRTGNSCRRNELRPFRNIYYFQQQVFTLVNCSQCIPEPSVPILGGLGYEHRHFELHVAPFKNVATDMVSG